MSKKANSMMRRRILFAATVLDVYKRQMVQDAGGIPLMSDRCVIEREKALDILDEIRANIPSDLKMAREIVEKRNEFITAGKREAEAIRKQAEELARQKVNENDIMNEARRRSAEIIRTAEELSLIHI